MKKFLGNVAEGFKAIPKKLSGKKVYSTPVAYAPKKKYGSYNPSKKFSFKDVKSTKIR